MLQNNYFVELYIYTLTYVCLLFCNKISTNINIGHTKRQALSHFFISRISKSAVLTSGVDIACYLPIAVQAKTTVIQDKSTLDKRISQYL